MHYRERNCEDCYISGMKHDAMRPLTISLSPKQLSRLSQAVESGAYASNSEVVRDALRLWEQREEIRALELARRFRAAGVAVLIGGFHVSGSPCGSDAPAEIRELQALGVVLVRGEVEEINEEVFAEVTFHAAYEPQRAVRTGGILIF